MDKIICLGKNYLEHAKELGDAIPEKPVLFLKPPSSAVILQNNKTVWLPTEYGELHHECEVVLRLSKGGFRMNLEQAEAAVGAVTLGLDMTLRELQGKLKKQGHPWEIAKAFPHSALIAPWVEVENFPNYQKEPFRFSVDNKIRQQGSLQEMRMTVAECVQYASQYFILQPGDWIFTGTPAGVGPVTNGSEGHLQWNSKVDMRLKWSTDIVPQ